MKPVTLKPPKRVKAMAESVVVDMGNKVFDHLRGRNNLSREDLEYVVEKVALMKDERLKEAIATLIGWGDDERAELETFVCVALELMRVSRPSVIASAARTVEIKTAMRDADRRAAGEPS